ncbi:MAG TPA: CBS domain-containing protein [Candidatus Nanoarchaeia archaeon]|nr:CBS domain-containing protein [Candidatus Nanoarchaeia archaeon]
MEDMKLDKINVHPVVTCSEDDSIEMIASKLREKQERRIFVVDAHKKLLGIITTTDLVYKVLSKCSEAERLKAKDIMIKNVKALDINEDLEKALEIMNELQSFTCPVTENGHIVGIISYHELVNHVFQTVK